MALSPQRNINGSGLLECLLLIPCEIAYSFFQDSPPVVFKEIAQHFQHKGDFVEKTLPFVEVDINRANNAEVLFREDSLTSKILRGIALSSDEDFLFDIVSPVVSQIVEEKIFYERNPEGQIPEELAEKVKSIVNGVLERILHSMASLPILYRVLLSNVTKMTAKAFPGKFVEQSILSSFFFLRYICPGFIATKYGVGTLDIGIDGYPLPVLRTLVLISKVLQAVGNGSGVESTKEKSMQFFSHFVDQKRPIMKKILERLREPVKIKNYISSSFRQYTSDGVLRAIYISHTLSQYIHNKISAERSLEGYLYDSMRILPSLSNSHPITWSRNEISIWLRKIGLEKYIPPFFSANITGKRLLLLDREAISIIGILSSTAHTEIMEALACLMKEYKSYVPTKRTKKKVSLWQSKKIVKWLHSFGYRVDCSILTTLPMTGPEFLNMPPDFLFCLGFNVKEVCHLRAEMRTLELSAHPIDIFSDIPCYSDNSTSLLPADIWLGRLNLSTSPVPPTSFAVTEQYYCGLFAHNYSKVYWYALDMKSGSLYQFCENTDLVSLVGDPASLIKVSKQIYPLDKYYAYPHDKYKENSFYLVSDKERIILQPGSQCAKDWVLRISQFAQTLEVPKLAISTYTTPLLSISYNSRKILAMNYASKILLCAPSIHSYDNKSLKLLFSKSTSIHRLLSDKGEKKITIRLYTNRMVMIRVQAAKYVENGKWKILLVLRKPKRLRVQSTCTLSEKNTLSSNETSSNTMRRTSAIEAIEANGKPFGFLDFIEKD